MYYYHYIQYPVLPLTRFTFVPYCVFNVLFLKEIVLCSAYIFTVIAEITSKQETKQQNKTTKQENNKQNCTKLLLLPVT